MREQRAAETYKRTGTHKYDIITPGKLRRCRKCGFEQKWEVKEIFRGKKIKSWVPFSKRNCNARERRKTFRPQ